MPDSQEIVGMECPTCGVGSIRTEIQEERFTYGAGKDEVELAARVPVRICSGCGSQFMDAEAEEAKHDAVCQHLGVLGPKKIIGIRKQHGLTRGAWAKLTRIGEASLSRWENGHLIQNASSDQLLYLLMFPDNVERLRERAEETESRRVTEVFKNTPEIEPGLAVDARFPAISDVTPARRAAQCFCLVSVVR
jgi:putative zinc finger/helix-turn-helix YgiT family protein